MPEVLQEYVDCADHHLRVDRTAGVIRGVKLLGLRSRNGRRYHERALADAVSLYEGAKVNVNHPKGHPLAPRDYQDRLGVIRRVALRSGDGLFGDLYFNPKHVLSEQLVWDAEHAPQNVGLSHNVLARTSREGDQTVVETITQVQSIDLVADPATTRGLFEQHDREADADENDDDPPPAVTWDELTVEQLRLHRPDLLEELQQSGAVLVEELRSRVDELSAREAAARRRTQISELLREFGLPQPDSPSEDARRLVSEQFVQMLLKAPDDRTLRRLVEARAALVRSAHQWQHEGRGHRARPRSRDQLAVSFGNPGGQVRSGRELAAAVRRR